MFTGMNILITGGTGTIGSYFVRALMKCSFESITILSRDETKQKSLRKDLHDSRIKYVSVDICDFQKLSEALVGIDIVIHTAAEKDLHLGEIDPVLFVKTNVLGTDNVLKAADKAGAKMVVCVSSDKGINPTNCMGMTKALGDRLIKNADFINTKVIGIRIGNVLGSTGSVIPFWISKIINGEKIGVTDINITRFVISQEDVFKLLLHAISEGLNGEIIIPDMKACRIHDMAKCLCKFYHLSDSEIAIVGARDGEKMYEELFSEDEAKYTYYNNGYFHVGIDEQSCKMLVPRKSSEHNLMEEMEVYNYLIKANVLYDIGGK